MKQRDPLLHMHFIYAEVQPVAAIKFFFCKSSRKHSEIAAKTANDCNHCLTVYGVAAIWKATALPAGTVSVASPSKRTCTLPEQSAEAWTSQYSPAGKAVWYVTVRVRTELLMAMKARPPRPKAIMLSPSSCQSESGASPATLCQPTIPCTSGQRSVQLQPESLEQSISGTLVAVAPEAPESVSWNSYPENTLGVPYG